MFELLTFPFFQRALLVGAILGILMAILGVFVILRKMSFFADAIGHSALAGIAIGLLFNINPFLAALVFSLLVAIGISMVRAGTKLSMDTLLGIFFSASVALGVVIVTLIPGYQADLISFLFGNILTVGNIDIVTSVGIAAIVTGVLVWAGKAFVAISLDSSLAKAEGVPVAQYELLFLLLLSAVIALAIKFVGVILVTALLVIPAASAQNIAPSLAKMFSISIAFSLFSVVVGMLASAALNTPSGPTIVLTSTLCFIASLAVRQLALRG